MMSPPFAHLSPVSNHSWEAMFSVRWSAERVHDMGVVIFFLRSTAQRFHCEDAACTTERAA